MRIAHLASECAPFAKTGGLGDVVGSLPIAQAELGHEVSVWLPLYRDVWKALDKRLTLDKIRALDFDAMLSKRRATRPRKRQTRSIVAKQKRPSRRGG